jgi:membrane associated rhomboid family serine protease
LLPLRDNIPTRSFPVVTVAIIAICVVVFFGFQHGTWDSGGKEKRVVEYAYIPWEFTHMGKECAPVETSEGTGVQCPSNADSGQPSVWLTVLFAMFMHGGILHIAGNMLFLWIFGNNIEDSMGRVRFIIFYLLGGLAATALQTVTDPNSMVPNLGASGAIAGVLGGYALLYPRARVATLIFIVFFVTVLELPALLVLGSWFVLELLASGQASGGASGGVAHFAHIGGFLFGLAAIKLFARNARQDYVEPRLPVY